MQADLTALRAVFQKHFVISALKATVANYGNDPEWCRVRPPLVELTREEQDALAIELKAKGFAMPGLNG